MERNLYLGIDSGLTNVKISVFDEGEIIPPEDAASYAER